MKFLRYFPLILTTAALLSLGSCKQDLGQDPPFDYPDEGSSGVQLPDPLYHLACDDDLFLDGTLAGEMKTFTGESPMFVDGKSGKAYQNVDGQALILTPDAASTTALKSLGSYSIFMWIKFDGTNKNAAGLFSIGNKTIEVADVAFFRPLRRSSSSRDSCRRPVRAASPMRGSMPATTPRYRIWPASGRMSA